MTFSISYTRAGVISTVVYPTATEVAALIATATDRQGFVDADGPATARDMIAALLHRAARYDALIREAPPGGGDSSSTSQGGARIYIAEGPPQKWETATDARSVDTMEAAAAASPQTFFSTQWRSYSGACLRLRDGDYTMIRNRPSHDRHTDHRLGAVSPATTTTRAGLEEASTGGAMTMKKQKAHVSHTKRKARNASTKAAPRRKKSPLRTILDAMKRFESAIK